MSLVNGFGINNQYNLPKKTNTPVTPQNAASLSTAKPVELTADQLIAKYSGQYRSDPDKEHLAMQAHDELLNQASIETGLPKSLLQKAARYSLN